MHCGTAGMVCQRCSGMAAQRKRSFVMGCSPRIRRIHVVVLPALRGQHARLRPTADWVELSPHVEHHNVLSDNHKVWLGEWRMLLYWSRAALAAHLRVAEPAQERPAMVFQEEHEHRHTVHLHTSLSFCKVWPPS